MDISLPCQHALLHYLTSIMLFSSPNGLCSSITESKHIKAVKEPWQQSSHYKALSQIVQTISQLDKLTTLHQLYVQHGMMFGTTSAYIVRTLHGTLPELVVEKDNDRDGEDNDNDDDLEDSNDIAQMSVPKELTSVTLPSQPGTFSNLQ